MQRHREFLLRRQQGVDRNLRLGSMAPEIVVHFDAGRKKQGARYRRTAGRQWTEQVAENLHCQI